MNKVSMLELPFLPHLPGNGFFQGRMIFPLPAAHGNSDSDQDDDGTAESERNRTIMKGLLDPEGDVVDGIGCDV